MPSWTCLACCSLFLSLSVIWIQGLISSPVQPIRKISLEVRSTRLTACIVYFWVDSWAHCTSSPGPVCRSRAPPCTPSRRSAGGRRTGSTCWWSRSWLCHSKTGKLRVLIIHLAQHHADLPCQLSDAVEVCLVLVVGVVVQLEGLAGAAGHGLVRGAQLQRLLGLPGRVDGSSLPGAACSNNSLMWWKWVQNVFHWYSLVTQPTIFIHYETMTHFKAFKYSPMHCDIMATVSPLVFLHEGQLEYKKEHSRRQ